MEETWVRRDLPVLEIIVSKFDESERYQLRIPELIQLCGLPIPAPPCRRYRTCPPRRQPFGMRGGPVPVVSGRGPDGEPDPDQAPGVRRCRVTFVRSPEGGIHHMRAAVAHHILSHDTSISDSELKRLLLSAYERVRLTTNASDFLDGCIALARRSPA